MKQFVRIQKNKQIEYTSIYIHHHNLIDNCTQSEEEEKN